MRIAKDISEFERFDVLSLDFETVSLTNKKIELFSLAAIDGKASMKNVVAGAFYPKDLKKLFKLLKGKKVIFWNFKFDGMVLLDAKFDIFSFTPIDAAIMAMLLNENLPMGLKWRAKADLGLVMDDWSQELVDEFRAGKRDRYEKYARLDPAATILLYSQYRERIKEEGLVTAFAIEMKAAIPIMFMEYNGIGFSEPICDRLEEAAKEAKLMYEDLIFEQAGYVFSLTKPKELGDFLYDDIEIPYKPEYSKKMKSGGRSVAKDILEQIRDDMDTQDWRFEMLENVLEWKRVNKLLSAFFSGQKDASRIYGDGRVHAEYNQLSIVTGRIASNNPNLMQLPNNPIIKKDDSTKIRNMYVSKPGHGFVDSDFNQIELRMMAHMSGDKNMIRAFKNDMDFHQFIADMCSISRKDAKIANFGKQYGMSPYSFAKKTKMTIEQARSFYSDYALKFPGTERVKHDILACVLDHGYIRLIGGRKRRLVENSTDDAESIKRAFVSGLIQGSSATVFKLALIKVFDRYRNKDAKIVLSVHDEMLVEAPEEMLPQVEKEVKEDMETCIELRVPIVANPKIGHSFGDFK